MVVIYWRGLLCIFLFLYVRSLFLDIWEISFDISSLSHLSWIYKSLGPFFLGTLPLIALTGKSFYFELLITPLITNFSNMPSCETLNKHLIDNGCLRVPIIHGKWLSQQLGHSKWLSQQLGLPDWLLFSSVIFITDWNIKRYAIHGVGSASTKGIYNWIFNYLCFNLWWKVD